MGPRLKSEDEEWLSGGTVDPKLLKIGIFRFKPLKPGLPLRKLCIFISKLGEVGSDSAFVSEISEDWLSGFSAGRREGLPAWELAKPKVLEGGLKLELESPVLCPRGALLTDVEETSEEEELGE